MDEITSSEEVFELLCRFLNQLAFKEDEVTKIVNDVIDLFLKDRTYDEGKVPQWINQICEEAMYRLALLKKPFKYIGRLFWLIVENAASAVIMQRNGAALHSSTSCYWDSTRDGMMID